MYMKKSCKMSNSKNGIPDLYPTCVHMLGPTAYGVDSLEVTHRRKRNNFLIRT